MSSSYSPWIYRNLLYKIPGLFIICLDGNYHLRWHKMCSCDDMNDCPTYYWCGKKYGWKQLKSCDC